MTFPVRSLAGVLLLSTLALPVRATPYWVAWEGDDYPENQGWERWWGDASDPSGLGATRTFANGAMTIDSLHNDQIWDFNLYAAPTLPDPGELFVAEWSLLVHPESDPADTQVVISGEGTDSGVALEFAPSQLHVVDVGLIVPYAGNEAHTFRLESHDGQNFTLWMDGALVGSGPYVSIGQTFPSVAFGDGVVGQRSKSTWDYVQFGIIPEPSGASFGVCFAALAACFARANSRTRGRGAVAVLVGVVVAGGLCIAPSNGATFLRQWNPSVPASAYDLYPLEQRIVIKAGSTQIFKFECFDDTTGQPAELRRIEIDNDGAGLVQVMLRGDPASGRLAGASNIIQGIDIRYNVLASYLVGMNISGNLGSWGISVTHINGPVSIGGSMNGPISCNDIGPDGIIAVGGQIPANWSINTSNAMAGTLIAYGPFLGACNFGSLTGTLDFRSTASGPINIESGNCGGSILFAGSYSGNLNVLNGNLVGTISVFDDFLGRASVSGNFSGALTIGDQLNGEIRVNGSLVNGSAAEEIIIGGSLGPAGAVAIDWEGADDGDDWQSGAVVKLGGTPYGGNAPGMKLYEISICRGDLDNDNDVDFFDIDPLIMAFDPGTTYDANYPGLSGSRRYHGDCDCDGDVDFFDIDPFVANLNHCVSDCEGARASRGGGEMTAPDPEDLANSLLLAVAPERTAALLAAIDALAAAPPAGSLIDWAAVQACVSSA